MKNFFWICILVLGLRVEGQINVGRGNARDLFVEHCAVCHGERGEGGLGGPLAHGEWKHTQTDEDRTRVIREGLPDFNKEGFEEKLNEREIRALVIYIRELREMAKDEPPPRPVEGVVRTQHRDFRLETVAESRGNMWGMDFLPDGRMIVTEINGPVRILDPEHGLGDPIRDTPEIVRHGQGGMLDVAVHPDYAENGWIYLSFADGSGRNSMTAVVRGRIRDGAWVDEEEIFRAEPEHRRNAGVHFGSRIVFQDGYVFFAIGDRGAQQHAQRLDLPNGKIFRLHDDGRVPEDNPFVDTSAYPAIWSYGHRNPQALAIRPENGEIWSTEHGPRGGDELNHIVRGENYGWPVVTHGMNYNGTPITEETEREDMKSPHWHWTPSIAVCGMAFVSGDQFPEWEGDLLVGGLRSEVVERLRLGEDGLEEREVILQGQGRVRDVRCGPDGSLYLILEGRGSRVVRLR
ncbi:MAG: PQQ-dependent sugar dehydrogenase [Verrucomicrobia bacterium]|nr:PQQ-dependent sugar dehydrogenase [Verrucomicrobiota bacterium]MCH8511644.1 PQQ-dependent sugar dehydrogenase [Kiritimatiellia bacterium]